MTQPINLNHVRKAKAKAARAKAAEENRARHGRDQGGTEVGEGAAGEGEDRSGRAQAGDGLVCVRGRRESVRYQSVRADRTADRDDSKTVNMRAWCEENRDPIEQGNRFIEETVC
ncbi:MAG: DUF4169 family protein [Litorimonas sp.]